MPTIRDARGRLPGQVVTAVAVSAVAGVSAALALSTAGSRPGLLAGATAGTALAAAAVLRRTARRDDGERALWLWLAAALLVLAAGAGGEVVLQAWPWSPQAGQLRGAALGSAVLLACPLVYQGLIHWNRYATLLSDPGDWLNGLGCVCAIAAIGNLVLAWSDSPLTHLPWWQLQGALFRIAAAVMLVGTAATVASLAGLQRDLRIWGVGVAGSVVTAAELVALFSGAGAAGLVWSTAGCAVAAGLLVWCAVLQPRPGHPRQATTHAPTVGALVVLLAGVAVLAVRTEHPGEAATAGAAALQQHMPTVCAVLAVLAASVRLLHLVRDLSQLARSRHEARTDELTGIANRRALMTRLEQAVARRGPVSLLILDLDRFKEINDRYGHGTGDALLCATAARLSVVVPSGGLLARLGGDEFAVLLAPTDGGDVQAGRDAEALAEVLAAAVDGAVEIDGLQLRTRASIGIATRVGDEPGVLGQELLRRADAAMYLAKGNGGGISRYDERIDAEARERTTLLEELRHALRLGDTADGQQIVVHYQPQLDLPSGDVAGAEALVRWQHPRFGLLAPARFLDLVEQHGLMLEVTRQVLGQAVRQATRWHAAGLPLRVSVNLSTSCLADPELLPLLDEVLATSGLDPRLLVLEVTETTLMEDPDQGLQMTRDITARGVGLSIDDYGTGYSSLAYLNDLPASELKLDRSFTGRLLTDARTAAIVLATIELAHRLGLRVVAEGVEDDATLTALSGLGCDESQGYLHARPLPTEEFSAWLAGRRTAAPLVTSRSGPAAVPAQR